MQRIAELFHWLRMMGLVAFGAGFWLVRGAWRDVCDWWRYRRRDEQ